MTTAPFKSMQTNIMVWQHRRTGDASGYWHTHVRINVWEPPMNQFSYRRSAGFGCFDDERLYRRATDERRKRDRRKDDLDGVTKIVQGIARRQYEIIDGFAPLEAGLAHAHLATFIDLWNRYVRRIPGLNEHSIRVKPL